jgi:hypothetical protein
MDMDRLGVLAADRRRAGDEVGPFGADIDETVTEPHLGMAELPILIGDDHSALEAESVLQPVEGSPGVLIEHACGQGGTAEWIIHGIISFTIR